MTLMFQQEVAERLCAPPGTSAYGRLGVLAQWTCEVVMALRVPPEAFVPPPKVHSAVVRLTPHDVQPPAELFAAMERLTATLQTARSADTSRVEKAAASAAAAAAEAEADAADRDRGHR